MGESPTVAKMFAVKTLFSYQYRIRYKNERLTRKTETSEYHDGHGNYKQQYS